MYFAKLYPDQIKKVVTLDNLRVPFVTNGRFKILSFRSKDPAFKTDPGVIPPEEVREKSGIEVVQTSFQHNDMRDTGPDEAKASIQGMLDKFLEDDSPLRPVEIKAPAGDDRSGAGYALRAGCTDARDGQTRRFSVVSSGRAAIAEATYRSRQARGLCILVERLVVVSRCTSSIFSPVSCSRRKREEAPLSRRAMCDRGKALTPWLPSLTAAAYKTTRGGKWTARSVLNLKARRGASAG